jgi:dTDP-D-glucose 4,6-dehydratase
MKSFAILKLFTRFFNLKEVLGINFTKHTSALDIRKWIITSKVVKKIRFILTKGYFEELFNIGIKNFIL